MGNGVNANNNAVLANLLGGANPAQTLLANLQGNQPLNLLQAMGMGGNLQQQS